MTNLDTLRAECRALGAVRACLDALEALPAAYLPSPWGASLREDAAGALGALLDNLERSIEAHSTDIRAGVVE